jgi:hypothetical protein
MSKININRNIFLEKEELARLQDFLINSTSSQALLDNTENWGIVRTVFTGVSPDFLIEAGSNSGTIKIAALSKAVDIDKLLIKQIPIDNIAVTAGAFYWVKISHKYINTEEGTCSIDPSGNLTGSGTLFSSVLRGQSTEVPVKIKFVKSDGSAATNSGIYEVSELNVSTPDISAILTGTTFTSESSLKYIVIGSTPLGETITSPQVNGLYQYDSCNIELVIESTLETPPSSLVPDKQFYVARVKNTSGTVAIEDKRGTQYLTLNVEGVKDKLAKDQNLADLPDKAAARTNLGIYSASEVDIIFSDSGWKSMVRSIVAKTTNFDLKCRRVGKQCIIQGTFEAQNMNADAVIASIAFSEIFATGIPILKPKEKIWFFCGPQVARSNSDNYGLFGYIPVSSSDPASPTFSNLLLKVDFADTTTFGTAKMNINISLFLG